MTRVVSRALAGALLAWVLLASAVAAPASAALSVSSPIVVEGTGANSVATFVVTETVNPVPGFNWNFQWTTAAQTATADADFTTTTATGGCSGSAACSFPINVPVAGDGAPEADETFTLTVSSKQCNFVICSGSSTATGTATIRDDDGATAGGDRDPPQTKITKRPASRDDDNSVKLKFKADEKGATFQCKLDGKKFKPCRSPRKLSVDEGKHKFKVRAVDAAGNADPSPAKDKFAVTG